MASKRYAAPLCLEPKRSRQLALLASFVVVGAAILPLLFSTPWGARLAVVAVAAVSARRIHRGHFGAQRIVRAMWDEHNQWRLWLADGSEREVALAGDSFVSPEVTILNFIEEKRRYSLVILSDVLDHDTRRRLRVRLLLQRVRRETAPSPGASDVKSPAE